MRPVCEAERVGSSRGAGWETAAMWSDLSASRRVAEGVGAWLLVVTLMVAVGVSSSPSAEAVPNPSTSANGQPPQFLPAPNPEPYCEGTEYFLPFEKGVQLYNAGGNLDIEPTFDQDNDGDPTNDVGRQTVLTDEMRTEPVGTPGAIVGTVVTSIPPGADARHAPSAWENGLDFTRDAVGTVTLSEPLFYSQWVFVDNDQTPEGFTLTPSWVGGASPEVLLTGGDSGFDFSGTSSSQAYFSDIAGGATRGHWLSGRVQADFFGPIDGLELLHHGAGGSGMAVGGGCPAIGVAKDATAPVWDAATQTYSVTYTIAVTNNLPSTASLAAATAAATAAAPSWELTGTPSGIPIEDIQVDDQLDSAGFTSVKVTDLTSTGLTENGSYNGTTDTELFDPGQSLSPEETATVTMDVEYSPDLSDVSGCPAISITNQARAQGEASAVPVEDLSDFGTDPGPASVNVTGTGTDDPTPVTFPGARSLRGRRHQDNDDANIYGDRPERAACCFLLRHVRQHRCC